MIEVEKTAGGHRLVSEVFESQELAAAAAKMINFLGMEGLSRFVRHQQATLDFQRVLADGDGRAIKAEIHLNLVPGRPAKARLLFEAEAPQAVATGPKAISG